MKLLKLLLVSSAFLGTAPVQAMQNEEFIGCPAATTVLPAPQPIISPMGHQVWEMHASSQGINHNRWFKFDGDVDFIADKVIPIADKGELPKMFVTSHQGKPTIVCQYTLFNRTYKQKGYKTFNMNSTVDYKQCEIDAMRGLFKCTS